MKCAATCMPPAVDNDDDIAASLTGWPNLLQMSAATFLVPAFIACLQQRPLGVAVYGGNAACSVYAHRPNRTSSDTWTDTLDLTMVAVWVFYNLALIVDTGLNNARIAVGLACVVLLAKIGTRYLVYRSWRRYIVHAIMHTSGSAGSALLLLS